MIQEQAYRVLHYPELYDKLNNRNYQDKGKGDKLVPESLPDVLVQPCVSSFLRGQCGNGHVYVKALVCGREWCPDCGKDGSHIHKRRWATRWYGKVMQMKKVGYLVFTIPEQLRETFQHPKAGTIHLKEFRKYITRKLIRMGYTRGLSRFHWAGDCPICKTPQGSVGCAACKWTGADTVFKPHLNVLIEEGYLTPERYAETIDVLKADLTKWFNKRYKTVLAQHEMGSFSGNIHYSYCGLNKKTKTDTPHRMHKLKYITRSTFRVYNKEIADLLKGFRTTSTWGKWEKNKLKPASDLLVIANGHCPKCLKDEGIIGEAIKWGGFIDVYDVINFRGREFIEGGYFYLDTS